MCYRFQSFLLFIGLVFGSMFVGCASQESAVVATIGGDKITLDEFNTMYAKSNSGKDTSQRAAAEDKEKFLDLYVKFRLKVKEAYAQGYENAPDIQAELQEYKRNLAVTLLIDQKISEPAIRRMYERKLYEVRSSHILLQMAQNASPAETLKTYMKAMKIIDSLKAGQPYETLALNNSQDPSVVSNKGDLGYVVSGRMVPEFEDAIFSVPAGTLIPYPIRTQFGYHIIKITDRRPNPGSIRVSHIIKRLTRQSTAEDSARAMAAMEAALDSLKHGAKFADIAKAISEDRAKEHGGDVGFIERGRTVKEFDDAAFKLKVGEISPIVKSQFGLHLIQVTEVKPIPSFAGMEQDLRNSYQQHYFENDYNSYIDGLKTAYNFAQSAEGVSAWKSSLDTTKTVGGTNWDSSFSASVRSKVLFSFAGQKITIDSVIQLVNEEKDLQGLPLGLSATTVRILDKISKNLLLGYKAQSMESEFSSFDATIKEYEEGSVLFKAEQNEVWNKIAIGDSALHVYFDANRSKFTWPDRVNFQEIFVSTDSVSKVVAFLLKKQKLPFDSVAAHYNTRQATKSKNGEWGLTTAAGNALTQRAWGMNAGELSDFFPYENGFSIIKVLEKIPAGNKTFGEAGSELTSAFQESESKRLENEWYEALLKKYPVSIHKEVLATSPEQTSKK